MKFAPTAIPAMALLQQHDERVQHQRSAASSSSSTGVQRSKLGGHSELGAFGNVGVRNWGRNRAVKTDRLVSLSVGPITNLKAEGSLFSAEFVCLCVCLSLTGTSTLQR